MTNFKDHSLKDYLEILAKKEPVPGGGAAAAMTAAQGAALISMVANYSLVPKQSLAVKKQIRGILKASERIRKQLLKCVDQDAEAYLKVVATRKGPERSRQAALRRASVVPAEVCRLCYEAVKLTPLLVVKGNPYLLSDVEVAIELLQAGFRSAEVNIVINQA